MTSEEFVKQKYPHSYTEQYNSKNVFDKKGHWLCWSSRLQESKRRLSEGTSKSNAWKNAKLSILEENKK